MKFWGNYNENKFDIAINFTKLISNNYLQEFYDFLDSNKSGRIGNGTIDNTLIFLLHFFKINDKIN